MRLIKTASLYNIRKFQKIQFDFKPGINIIIGKNGTCKTTLLKSLFLSIFSSQQINQFKKFSMGSFIGNLKEEAALQVTFGVLEDNFKLKPEEKVLEKNFLEAPELPSLMTIVREKGKEIFYNQNEKHAGMVFGNQSYINGAFGSQRNHHVSTLINHHKRDNDSHEQIVQHLFGSAFGAYQVFCDPRYYHGYHLDEERLDTWHRYQKKLWSFLGYEGYLLKLEHDKLFLVRDTDKIIFNDLSDGEKSIAFMVMEILYNASEIGNINFDDNVEGLVIIDEIETHLHPELQGRIANFLKELFPLVQFIITTHSPYVVMNALRHNIISLGVKDNSVYIKKNVQPLPNIDIKSIAESPQLFDSVTIPLDLFKIKKRYRDLVDKSFGNDLSINEEKELTELAINLIRNEVLNLESKELEKVLLFLGIKHGVLEYDQY